MLPIYLRYTIFLDIINCDVDDGCHDNATCTDANGNYTCACTNGFTGDGFNCTGKTFGHSLELNYNYIALSYPNDMTARVTRG